MVAALEERLRPAPDAVQGRRSIRSVAGQTAERGSVRSIVCARRPRTARELECSDRASLQPAPGDRLELDGRHRRERGGVPAAEHAEPRMLRWVVRGPRDRDHGAVDGRRRARGVIVHGPPDPLLRREPLRSAELSHGLQRDVPRGVLRSVEDGAGLRDDAAREPTLHHTPGEHVEPETCFEVAELHPVGLHRRVVEPDACEEVTQHGECSITEDALVEQKREPGGTGVCADDHDEPGSMVAAMRFARSSSMTCG